MTHKEIADELGVTEGTSKSQLHKAKQYLKDRLEALAEAGYISTYEGVRIRKVV
jgi:DNA-directed RNA polymerase specialized sigma24 family protein